MNEGGYQIKAEKRREILYPYLGGGGGGGADTAEGAGISGKASKSGKEGAIPGPKSDVINKSPAI